jgi:hypothetical protein
MATVSLDVVEQFADQEIVDTALGATLQSPGGNTNYIFQVRIDNSANTSAVYLKIYDAASAASVTVGTTDPDMIFPCAGESVAEFSLYPGAYITNGLHMACVTTPGTAGTTSPSSSVIVRLLTGNNDSLV